MKHLLLAILLISGFAANAQQVRSYNGNNTGLSFSDQDIQIFPNPFTSYITINAPVGEVNKIFVYNTIGTKMKSFSFESNQRYYVGDLPRGIYLVQFVSQDNKILTTRRVSKKD